MVQLNPVSDSLPDSFPKEFGRYQLVERLAQGGMAELFLADIGGAHGFAKTVVIKRILPHLAANKQFTTMFIEEAKITAQLVHPKIAQTFELGTEAEQLFIVMEYIDGLDVLALLRECAHRRFRVPSEITVYIIKEVLDALDFAHKLKGKSGTPLGIVHRDISPSNILLSKRGDVKLVDFGIAHADTQEGQTKSGLLKGKYGYMSPEQLLSEPVSPRSDIFACGVVMAEMLMGRRLFAAPNELDVLLMVRDVNLDRLNRFGGHIQEDLIALLHRALQKNSTARFEDAAAFRDALEEWLFDNRHRVTSSNISEIVAALYVDAAKRRKERVEVEHKNSVSHTEDPEETPLVTSEESSSEEVEEENAISSEDIIDEEPSIDVVSGSFSAKQPSEFRMDFGVKGGESSSFDGVSEASSVEINLGSTDVSMESLMIDSNEGNVDEEVLSPVVALEPDPASKDFDDSNVSDGGVPVRQGSGRLEQGQHLSPSAPPKPPSLKREGEGPAQGEGLLTEQSALTILYNTTVERENGKVVFRQKGVSKEIYFNKGVPEYVASNVPSELFGAYLVRTEVLSSGELDMALAVIPHFGGKLGDTLVGLGLMKPLEVFRHLTRQVRSKLIEVCTWTEGNYEWHPGVSCPDQAFPLDLDPLEVYGAAALAMEEEGLTEFVRKNGTAVWIVKESSIVVPELFQVPGLRRCQEAFDGVRTVNDVILHLASSNNELRHIQLIYLLACTNLISGV